MAILLPVLTVHTRTSVTHICTFPKQNMLLHIQIFSTCPTVKKDVPKVEKVVERDFASGGKWNGRSVIGVPSPPGRNSWCQFQHTRAGENK